MTRVVEFYRWWITDDRTGERRLTEYKLSRADAQRAVPGAVPDAGSREVRNSPRPGDASPTAVRKSVGHENRGVAAKLEEQ
jgi:hypothetical protein